MFRRTLGLLRLRPATPAIRHFATTPAHAKEPAHIDPTIREPLGTIHTHSTPVRRKNPTLASFSLEGKSAIVTGGARGLGYVMAQALAESGSRVAILDLDGTEAAKAAQRLTEHLRATAQDDADVPLIVSHTVDVGNVESVEAAFLAVRGELGVVNTLVTSAGFCENFGAEDYPAERIRRLFDVNFFGTYFCASALARNLIEQKERGSIVFIGSMSGSVVNIPQKQAPYNASKAAVRHLAASMAVEWAPHGIRVNCISPGYMLTDLTKRILKEKPELGLSWTEKTPAGRMGKPADLMGAVVYLASDASDYVTGAELKVDGGYTAI